MKRVKPTCKNISPNQRRLRLMELSGISLTDKQKKRLLSESVSMVLPQPKHERDRVSNSMIWNGNDISDIEDMDDEEEIDLEEILNEMGYYGDEEELSSELTEEELESLINGLEDDTVNEFNFNSKGYKEGRKLVDKLRRDLFRKLSDDELDEFMNVLSNSFDLIRK
jgi:hypothetical protein